jgi:hypothetical protein
MRALASQLSTQMGVPFVIDNKPGGSYTIGTMDLVNSPPDGYTLAYGNIVSLATNRALMSKLPYDVDRDLTLVANALRVSNLLIVNNDVPAKERGGAHRLCQEETRTRSPSLPTATAPPRTWAASCSSRSPACRCCTSPTRRRPRPSPTSSRGRCR